MSPALAALLASAVALAGRRAGWLSTNGVLAAAGVGTLVLAGRGIPGGIVLSTFFVSGSLLTRLSARPSPDSPGSSRSTARSASQVLANGCWAALAAVAAPADAGWALFAGALSAAQSDTWATEVGSFSRSLPRMLTTGRVVDRGTSGAVTLLGTCGGIAGGLIMGALAWQFTGLRTIGIGVAVGGCCGMLADSVLGATVQGMYFCSRCNRSTESRPHRCGTEPRLTHGMRWLNNDGVNLAATGVGAIVALAIWLLV